MRFRQTGEGDGALILKEGIQKNLEGLCSPESSCSAAVNKVSQFRIHRNTVTKMFSKRQEFPVFPSRSRPTRGS